MAAPSFASGLRRSVPTKAVGRSALQDSRHRVSATRCHLRAAAAGSARNQVRSCRRTARPALLCSPLRDHNRPCAPKTDCRAAEAELSSCLALALPPPPLPPLPAARSLNSPPLTHTHAGAGFGPACPAPRHPAAPRVPEPPRQQQQPAAQPARQLRGLHRQRRRWLRRGRRSGGAGAGRHRSRGCRSGQRRRAGRRGGALARRDAPGAHGLAAAAAQPAPVVVGQAPAGPAGVEESATWRDARLAAARQHGGL